MAFEELFLEYPNRNAELRMVASMCYEYGFTIAQEPSAAMSSGLDEHALARQEGYITRIRASIESIHDKPIPDLPASHPTQFPVNMSSPYLQFRPDGAGNDEPINEQTRLLAQQWMLTAVELVKSQSASLGGSLTDPDHLRATHNVDTIAQLVAEIDEMPAVDLPETAKPGSTLTAGKSKK